MRYTVVINSDLPSFKIEIEPEYLDCLLSILCCCTICVAINAVVTVQNPGLRLTMRVKSSAYCQKNPLGGSTI